MESRNKRTKAGWMHVDDMVKRWMQQRIELTQHYEAIATPFPDEERIDELVLRIHQFCQTLVDYVSAGHFEVYNELILEARAFNDGSITTGIDLCKAIEESTDLALEFNDRFEREQHSSAQLSQLPKQLVELGGVLNLRFELEDHLIAAVHDCHKSLVA